MHDGRNDNFKKLSLYMCPASILYEVLLMNHWFLFSICLLGCHSEGAISMLLKNGKYSILGYDYVLWSVGIKLMQAACV